MFVDRALGPALSQTNASSVSTVLYQIKLEMEKLIKFENEINTENRNSKMNKGEISLSQNEEDRDITYITKY